MPSRRSGSRISRSFRDCPDGIQRPEPGNPTTTTRMAASLRPWLLATRPKTLPAAVVPVVVGSVPAAFGFSAEGGFRTGLFLATLASCLCIQVATNLFNDAIDSRKGADTEKRLGPTRVTASGLLSARSVLLGAIGFCVLAALISLPLIQARGVLIVAIGAVSLVMAFAYTGGPFPLAYRGMGELFVILFFGLVAVMGSWFVQSGEGPGTIQWITALQVGLYSCVLIAINNLRDIDEDRGTGKRTLAVRLGKRFARTEIATFCLLPPVLAIAGAILLESPWFALPAVLFSLGKGITRKIRYTEPSPVYNGFLALGAVQLLAYAVLVTLAFWLMGRGLS